MNSSSSINDVKAKAGNLEPEVVIEYEPEPKDYNYVPPETVVDEEELRQLRYTSQGADAHKVALVVAIIVAAAIIGAGIGWVIGAVAESNANEQRKSTLASAVQRSFEEKAAGFDKFVQDYESIKGDYNSSRFDNVMTNLSKYNFMLDMSSEVSSEVILLNETQAGKDAVNGLRKFSANTMLLTQLLNIHRNETNIDQEEIEHLLDKDASKAVIYALNVNSDGIYYLGTNAPRDQFANGVINIYTLRDKIDNPAELSETYTQYKTDNRWSPIQRGMRDYVPTKADGKTLDNLDLPNRIMYQVADRKGRESYFFADQLIMIDRKKLFGNAATALQRYEQRRDQITALIEDTKGIMGSISANLGTFISDKDKAANKNKTAANKPAENASDAAEN